MPRANDHRPGMFWTWQDAQVRDATLVRESLADMAAKGFGTVLVQPRGCRFALDGDAFIQAVRHACDAAHDHGLALWLHLDPRSMCRQLIAASGEAAEYLIVAGTGELPFPSDLRRRALDAETPVARDGTYRIRLEYPKTRPYHVHSDGALAFRPLRLERCLVYTRDEEGLIRMSTVADVTASAELFVNELSGYVEVFGRTAPAPEPGCHALALVAFGSNYPDFAGAATRAAIRASLDAYVAAGVRLDGLWWDEPGYCTGFDRAFRADRGRIPWSTGLAALHRQRTGREPIDDALYLLAETDDDLWGARREAYYRTLESAVFGAQADLVAHMRASLGDHARMGVHQTWHQNADDVINGCMDWWRGAGVLGAGFSDVGDAERVGDPAQMAEVTALGTIAVSLGRHSARREAFYNLWGVHYGEEGVVPGIGIVDWWVDLQAALGCNWLAHTYGPTGYFERPSVWGPGYPDHATWAHMEQATGRLARALELARGALPEADVALVYPLGTLYRLGSDLANPLAQGCHALIDALVRTGFELDIVSAEVLRRAAPDRYRAVICLHPFGATPSDVEDLGSRAAAGAVVAVAGVPCVPGVGYAGTESWREHLGLPVPELPMQGVLRARDAEDPGAAAEYGAYRGLTGWGRPIWNAPDASDQTPRVLRAAATEQDQDVRAGYLGLLLEGFGDGAPELLSRMGVAPSWRVPAGAVASRTRLPDGETLVRISPARFGRPFHGDLHVDGRMISLANGVGLSCFVMGDGGDVRCEVASPGLAWSVGDAGVRS